MLIFLLRCPLSQGTIKENTTGTPRKLTFLDNQLLTCDLGMLVTNVNLSTEMSSVSGYNKGLNTMGTPRKLTF